VPIDQLAPGSARRHGRRPVRMAAAVSGGVLSLAGLGFVAGAGLQAGEGGYFGTPEHRFGTGTAALKTDEIDVRSDVALPADPSPDVGELAKVRIVVKPKDPRVPLFVGIGRKADVEAYLRGTSYDEFASARLAPFRADFRRVPGAAGAPAPEAQRFWVAASSGTGTRTVTWDKTQGKWSVVVMRGDGRPGLDVEASMGLRFGFLAPTGLVLLLCGVLTLGWSVLVGRRPSG
jgi:hypothetical protein